MPVVGAGGLRAEAVPEGIGRVDGALGDERHAVHVRRTPLVHAVPMQAGRLEVVGVVSYVHFHRVIFAHLWIPRLHPIIYKLENV